MKIVIYILQIIAAFLYSGLFSYIAMVIVVCPTMYFLSLPWWAILLIILILGTLISNIFGFLIGLIMMPYLWIVKNNTTSLIISILTICIDFIIGLIKMWQYPFHGFWQTLVVVIVSLLSISLAIKIIYCLIGTRINKI